MDSARCRLFLRRARGVTRAVDSVRDDQEDNPRLSDTAHAGEAWSRRERGISAYARIFAVSEQEVPATLAARVGPAFAEEAL